MSDSEVLSYRPGPVAPIVPRMSIALAIEPTNPVGPT